MKRDPIRTAAAYHRATSYRRHALTPHTLNWEHPPRPDKRYPPLERIVLPSPSPPPATDYFDLVRRAHGPLPSPAALDLHTIATFLHLTHAITAHSRHGGQPFYFRSVASAGALYPFEMYLAAYGTPGLDPGVYHVDLFSFGLTRLRHGQVPALPPVRDRVTATVYITGIFFRSAWKYRSRAYRYVLLDAGHLLENLRLAAHAVGVGISIHMDFDDDDVATLLGLDEAEEACLAVVHLHAGDGAADVPAPVLDGGLPALAADIRRASTVSDRVVTYGEILEIHQAGRTPAERLADVAPLTQDVGWRPQAWQGLPAVAPERHADYVRVLRQRRSRRNFFQRAISMNALACFFDPIVNAATADLPGFPHGIPVVGLLAGSGLAIAPGLYLLDGPGRRLGQVDSGNRMAAMATACLDQMWLKNAALHLLFLADLAGLDRIWGARGYRYAMIAAGRLGQQAYLAATAMGWGACGIGALYDREAADRLALAGDAALLYLVGVGPLKSP